MEAPETPADLLESEGLDATLQHIGLLRRKRQHLLATQVEAEKQFLHRLSGLYANGAGMSDLHLAFAYLRYTEFAAPGFKKHWNAIIGVPAERMMFIVRAYHTEKRHTPNMPDGTWRGSWPRVEGDRLPINGTCIVYVLYDVANAPCYVGSTQDPAGRLNAHAKNGKQFTHWTAFACADREAAYQLEVRLLNEHQPYLNRKRGR